MKELLYLYCGSADVDRDLKFYCEGLGGQSLWRKEYGGTTVAALRLGTGPLLLLASHRPVPSVLPIWSVDDLDSAVAGLKQSGWQGPEHRVEIPDGPCAVLSDESGNEIALLHQIRPQVTASFMKEP